MPKRDSETLRNDNSSRHAELVRASRLHTKIRFLEMRSAQTFGDVLQSLRGARYFVRCLREIFDAG